MSAESTPPLAERHCRACSGGDQPLAQPAIDQLLDRLDPSWQLDTRGRLTRTFDFPDFRSALSYLVALGEEAERQGHHPRLVLRWGHVDVRLTTHAVGGLTDNDFILAARADRLYTPEGQ
ncbi:MAG: 4a-hydroxytetrahydrobiopterin dehydratase [Planctomycetota bacterium]